MNNYVAWFNEQLGRITMYALVLYSLIALVLMALLLMIVGNINYSPLSFLLSVAVSVGVSYGSNRLFGWLFGVKPHSESALITGLILSLLFSPPTAAVEFVKIGLVAAIAMASKYIIAVRNRHIFNPAAIAIVIASIGGLAYAGWWVATPGMIPISIVVGALILNRTKKVEVSSLFVVVAIVSLWIQGTDPITALTSWPLLFVGAIMLSEPLTLPPRAKQQYIVAAVVGLLMTLPLHYSRITMTPALALVIGNFIGWWYSQRRAIKLRYVGKSQMGASTYNFLFDADKLKFEPGQYLELGLPHEHADIRGHRRIFSIAAHPGDEQISIGTKMPTKPSSFKRALMNLKPGTTLYATRVGGDFVLPEDKSVPIVCIAGGIGVTPFISFLTSSDRPFQLIYATSSVSELSYVDVLKQHNINVTVVSPDSTKLPDRDWKHEQGELDKDLLKKLINIDKQPIVYISGPPAMVTELRDTVKALGIKKIKVDEFSGY
jgi:ferredoxin-NADP reductase